MAVLSTNHVSAFCMRLCIDGGSYVKYTYMIGREHSHMVLSDHASLSLSEEHNKIHSRCHTVK